MLSKYSKYSGYCMANAMAVNTFYKESCQEVKITVLYFGIYVCSANVKVKINALLDNILQFTNQFMATSFIMLQ